MFRICHTAGQLKQDKIKMHSFTDFAGKFEMYVRQRTPRNNKDHNIQHGADLEWFSIYH